MNKLFRIYLDEFDIKSSFITDEYLQKVEDGELVRVSSLSINKLASLSYIHRNALISRAMRLSNIRGTVKPTLEKMKDMALNRELVEKIDELLNTIKERIPDVCLSAFSEDQIREEAEFRVWLSVNQIDFKELSESEQAKLSDRRYHVRHLRRRASTARQALASVLGTIGYNASSYADSFALSCWKERQESAKSYGLSHNLSWTDRAGSTRLVSLFEIFESSRKARFAQLYAQTVALDKVATKRNLIPIFITITLPPQYHPNPKFGLPYGGNDIEDCPLPTDTDKALQHIWKKFRARASVDKIELLGLKVVEPHLDGCPHLHCLLYVKDISEVGALDRHLQALRPEPVDGERIATKLEILDRTRAKPASYVMKYLIKCLPAYERASELSDGTCDESGDPDHLAHHCEVRAWASERRLRQFAWLGLHGLRTAWQRLYQSSEADIEDAPRSIIEATKALKEGRWSDALEALGAIKSDNKARPRIAYVDARNKYGEPIRKPDSLTLEEWSIKLKHNKYEIVQVINEAVAHEMPISKTEQIARQNAGLTVIVSYPSSAVLEDSACKTIERTGPPPALEQNNDAEMQLINI